MAITRQSALTDVAFAVCTALHNSGTKAVLTGGSAAVYYAPERYQSRDADFVITMCANRAAAAAALRSLGFTEHGGIYRHVHSPYTVEFPPGPLAIGNTIIEKYETVQRDSEILHVISRTDAVCLSLAKFYHWSDRSSLRTALDVAQSGEVDLERVATWSRNEGCEQKFEEFAERYGDEISRS